MHKHSVIIVPCLDRPKQPCWGVLVVSKLCVGTVWLWAGGGGGGGGGTAGAKIKVPPVENPESSVVELWLCSGTVVV